MTENKPPITLIVRFEVIPTSFEAEPILKKYRHTDPSYKTRMSGSPRS